MKRLRSIIASILAIVMSFTMSATAFADANGKHTITLDPTDTHEYRVFQVLTGTLSEEGSDELGNPEWGADAIADPGDVDAFITSITASGLTEQQKAELVAAKVNTEGQGRGTVKQGSPLSGLDTGYYVMVDVTQLTGDHKLETSALHVVRVVNDIKKMAIKWGTTEDQKTIVSDTLGEATNDNPHGVNAAEDNVSIGDTVNFKITASIPSNADLYNYFYFVVNDTLDPGLTLTEESIKVYKESVADANLLVEKVDDEHLNDYILKTGAAAAPCSFQVGLVDAKSLAGKDIIVTYSAVLNKDAKIGETANKNTSTVTYSNNPNHTYNGENKNPGFPASVVDSAFGVTPKTETETYTTGIEIQKVDEDGNVLTGATFTLTGTSLEQVVTVAETFVEATDGNYYLLKDGTYTKDVPTTEGEYMVPAEEGAQAGYVVAEDNYDGNDAKVVGGVTYRDYVPADDAGKEVFILHNGNGYLYQDTNKKYKKELTKTLTELSAEKDVSMEVNANGLARFDGLGAGTYTIKETVTPAGYNTLADTEVTITFNADGTTKWSFSGGNGAYDSAEGIYKIKIENNKGTQLPSTGGIGTTIFYIVGGIMVAGAVVFLLTKRRIAESE